MVKDIKAKFKFLKHNDVVDFNTIGIKEGIWLLAIPMILELILESVFSLVDLYFVGHLPNSQLAIQIIGFTESINTIIYSIAVGFSVAISALISISIGQKKVDNTGKIIIQALIIASIISLIISTLGYFYAPAIFTSLNVSQEAINYGISYPKIIFSNSLFILLLFLINGIFRGIGNPLLAMKSLWIANGFNLLLCPLLINGWIFIPALGIEGAAWATVSGRTIGVLYQLYCIRKIRNSIGFQKKRFELDFPIIKSIISIATPGIFQYILASLSWIYLAQLIAKNGGEYGSAGFQIAVRVMLFFILPIWGLSNAVATLTGQYLGAHHLTRIKVLTKIVLKYTLFLCLGITLINLFFAENISLFFTNDIQTIIRAKEAMKIISLGYIAYGVSMIFNNLFNGAGNTQIPTLVNFLGFWIFQIPFAYYLIEFQKQEYIYAIWLVPITETILCFLYFTLWKKLPQRSSVISANDN
ncbi:MATE family efflux transporter [Flavobacterium oreochromis]|uniref:MATE family efflux transporter n=1 Tax=Flavobacterium oreochromis TaxID=2906078 RepID=UPI00385DEEF7